MPKRSYHRLLDEHLHILISQGNHEAYQRLKKRYRHHSQALCHDFLTQYIKTGIALKELVAVVEGCFLSIVRKYDSALNSFFSFWKEITVHNIMEYMIDNAYIVSLEGFRGLVSIDEHPGDKNPVCDMVCEKDDDRIKKRKIFEIKSLIARHEETFSHQESTLLKFVLEGYSLGDLEHVGVMSKSTLYLTFNTAVEKLQNLIKRIKRNK